jgi:FtsH-binding integral membrane protein
LLAEVAQIAAAFVWVALYSYLIAPGQPVAAYHAYAQLSGPWVSIVAGFPVFFAVSYRLARNVSTGVVMFLVFFAIDGGILLATTSDATPVPWGLAAVSYATKLIACVIGGWLADRRRALQSARLAASV